MSPGQNFWAFFSAGREKMAQFLTGTATAPYDTVPVRQGVLYQTKLELGGTIHFFIVYFCLKSRISEKTDD